MCDLKDMYLIILDMPSSSIGILLFPCFILGYSEERQMLLTLTDFHDRCDELDQEAWNLKETREEMVEEVDNETFDVRTIMILNV